MARSALLTLILLAWTSSVFAHATRTRGVHVFDWHTETVTRVGGSRLLVEQPRRHHPRRVRKQRLGRRPTVHAGRGASSGRRGTTTRSTLTRRSLSCSSWLRGVELPWRCSTTGWAVLAVSIWPCRPLPRRSKSSYPPPASRTAVITRRISRWLRCQPARPHPVNRQQPSSATSVCREASPPRRRAPVGSTSRSSTRPASPRPPDSGSTTNAASSQCRRTMPFCFGSFPIGRERISFKRPQPFGPPRTVTSSIRTVATAPAWLPATTGSSLRKASSTVSSTRT